MGVDHYRSLAHSVYKVSSWNKLGKIIIHVHCDQNDTKVYSETICNTDDIGLCSFIYLHAEFIHTMAISKFYYRHHCHVNGYKVRSEQQVWQVWCICLSIDLNICMASNKHHIILCFYFHYSFFTRNILWKDQHIVILSNDLFVTRFSILHKCFQLPDPLAAYCVGREYYECSGDRQPRAGEYHFL